MRFLSRPFSKRVEDSLLSPRLQDVRSMEAGSKLAASRRRSSVPSVTSLSSLPIIPAITEARSASAITNISCVRVRSTPSSVTIFSPSSARRAITLLPLIVDRSKALHAFDLSTIRGRRVIARRAEDGEKIVTLDGVERTLTQEMLVIADAERASVIAGIMGSEDSEVTEGTEDLLLEAANFEPASILRTSWSLGLRSESSTRFEKGLDRNLIPQALDFACSLLAELCCGEVSNGTVDVSAGNVEPWEIRLRPRRVQDVAGKLIEEQEIVATLQSLGCSVSGGGEDLKVVIPTFRPDLEREIDLVEEVVRVHGLNRLPSTLPCRRAGRGGLTE